MPRRGTLPEVASAPPTLIDVLRLSTTYLGDHGSPSARGARGQISASATSDAVAQNDISKPGCTTTSGSVSRMISAASARDRRLIA